MTHRAAILALTAAVLCFARTAAGQDDDRWRAADAATVRLAPSAFPQLPRAVARALTRRGCTVPQASYPAAPHNVISGRFARKGQTDWAVLCSRRGSSAILVFWGGTAKSVAEIARARDASYLQTIDGAGKIGFSRSIGVADRKHILRHYRELGGPKPPPITHDGIENAFVEKASGIHYFHHGRWLRLQGMD